MKPFRLRCLGLARGAAAAAFSVVLVAGCGGSDGAPFTYLVQYALPQSPVFPAGTITVSPPTGRMAISADGTVRVALELAGFPVQTLDGPNFQPKDNPQLKYVFGLPEALAPESKACVTGQVTVTSITGVAVPNAFQLCAGTEFTQTGGG